MSDDIKLIDRTISLALHRDYKEKFSIKAVVRRLMLECAEEDRWALYISSYPGESKRNPARLYEKLDSIMGHYADCDFERAPGQFYEIGDNEVTLFERGFFSKDDITIGYDYQHIRHYNMHSYSKKESVVNCVPSLVLREAKLLLDATREYLESCDD
jgi:hypothetical protein